ncbi:MAG TPA: hypothetical protein VKY92_04005 [Verrucomicrobiae bacterium]|nr:hypothetical protein [Verrucomicrobiae bacterium]
MNGLFHSLAFFPVISIAAVLGEERFNAAGQGFPVEIQNVRVPFAQLNQERRQVHTHDKWMKDRAFELEWVLGNTCPINALFVGAEFGKLLESV